MKSTSIAAGMAALAAALAPSAAAQGTPEQEPNGGPATATTHVLGTQSYGDLTAGDADWFRVVVPLPVDLRCWTAPGLVAQAGDTRLALYDHAGNQIQEVDDGSPATHGSYSLLEEGSLLPGTYYLRVRGFDNSTTGSYTLDAMALPPGQLVQTSPPVTPVQEAPEPNDPRLPNATSTGGPLWALVSGTVAVGALGPGYAVPGADYDFYKVVVQSPGLLTLGTAAGPAPAAADTVLHVCDAALTPLAMDDDGGPGFYSLLLYQVTAPGVYFAVVSDYGTGNYELAVDFAATMPSGAATVVIHPGGCGPSGGVPAFGTRATPAPSSVRPELPVIGTTFYVDLTNVPANRLIARLFNLTPLQTPLSLAPFGAPGCDSEVDDPFVDFSTTDGNGVHFWGLLVPAAPSLIGLPLEKQVAVLDTAFNVLGARLSNRVSSVLGVSH